MLAGTQAGFRFLTPRSRRAVRSPALSVEPAHVNRAEYTPPRGACAPHHAGPLVTVSCPFLGHVYAGWPSVFMDQSGLSKPGRCVLIPTVAVMIPSQKDTTAPAPDFQVEVEAGCAGQIIDVRKMYDQARIPRNELHPGVLTGAGPEPATPAVPS